MKNTIKVERAKKDMTQEDLAKELSVSRQTINAIEKSKYAPSVVLALKMARLFDIPMENLFSLDEND